jgi:hypothetical protein
MLDLLQSFPASLHTTQESTVQKSVLLRELQKEIRRHDSQVIPVAGLLSGSSPVSGRSNFLGIRTLGQLSGTLIFGTDSTRFKT